MCSGASIAAPPNYKRIVQFSLSVVSKASFLIFLTPEDDTNYKPTLRNIPDEQTPGFISLMIRAGGRRAVVNTVMYPMGVHVMRGISTLAKRLKASPGGLYSVAWLTAGHLPHTAAVPVVVSRYVLWADIGKAQLWCQAVRPASQQGPHYLPVRTAPVCCYGPNRKHSDITKFTAHSYRYKRQCGCYSEVHDGMQVASWCVSRSLGFEGFTSQFHYDHLRRSTPRTQFTYHIQ
jgi:hypothetical protein